MSDRTKLIGVNLDKPVLRVSQVAGDACPACEVGILAEDRHGRQTVEGIHHYCLLCGQRTEVVSSAG